MCVLVLMVGMTFAVKSGHRNRPDQDGYNILAKLLAVASLAHNQPVKRRPRNRVIRVLRPLARSTPFIAVWVSTIDLIALEIHCTTPNYTLPPPKPPFRVFSLTSIRKLTKLLCQLPSPLRHQLSGITQYARIRAAVWDKSE